MARSTWFSQLGIKGRILSMIWVSVFMATGVVGINYWAHVIQASQVELQSKLMDNMMTVRDFGLEIKTLGLAAMDALVDADSGAVTQEVEADVASFARYHENHRQELLRIGEELGKKFDTEAMLRQTDSMYKAVLELLGKVKNRNTSDKAFSVLDDEVDTAQSKAFQLSQDLGKRAIDLHHESVLSLTKISVIMTYLTVGANIALLVMLLMMGLRTARNIERGTDQSSRHLSQTVGALSTVVADLDKAGHTLAGTATEQNASVTETVSAMTEIQSVIKRSSEYSRSVVHLAKEAKARSEDGSNMMSSLSQAVQAVKLANQELEEIKKIFQKIEGKTAVVNNISFKTQLLSFNASIEAARAGANGRGFSVVALEVGRLADMSAKAADEIGGMLKESVTAVADIVERLSSKVEEASRTNAAALGQFSHIVTDINEISGKISEIEHGINEQSAGVDQCVKAMQQLSLASQSNDELSTDIANLSSKLQSRTRELEDTVVQLNQVIQGGSSQVRREKELSARGQEKKPGATVSPLHPTDKMGQNEPEVDQTITDERMIDEIASATQRLIQNGGRHADQDARPVKKSA